MTTFVVDASIVMKWVVEEPGTPEALALKDKAHLIAPDLLVAECATVLWKKVVRGELERDEALLAARLLQSADIELLPTRSLLETAAKLALDLDHAAYDCIYLALAIDRDCPFVTADSRFVLKVEAGGHAAHRKAISLQDAASS